MLRAPPCEARSAPTRASTWSSARSLTGALLFVLGHELLQLTQPPLIVPNLERRFQGRQDLSRLPRCGGVDDARHPVPPVPHQPPHHPIPLILPPGRGLLVTPP